MDKENGGVEVRGFLHLYSFLRKEFGTYPVYLDLESPISGRDLAEKLGIDLSKVEVIFVNGFVEDLNYLIKQGDRVAFLPPGCPGPYRIALGFYGKNQDNDYNFNLHGKR